MFDLRSRGPVAGEDEAWLLQTFFPLIETELEHTNYLANLVTPSHYAHIVANYGLDFVNNFSEQTKLGIFMAEQEAVAWLLKSRADR